MIHILAKALSSYAFMKNFDWICGEQAVSRVCSHQIHPGGRYEGELR
jgi:hypothetical protein